MPGFATFCSFFANLLPAGTDGLTVGEVSLIRPEDKDDVGLLAHEARHRYQQANYGPFILGSIEWLGRYAKELHFRLSQEAEAYAYQLAAYPPEQHAAFRQTAIAYLCSATYGLLGNDGLDQAAITQALDDNLTKLGIVIG